MKSAAPISILIAGLLFAGCDFPDSDFFTTGSLSSGSTSNRAANYSWDTPLDADTTAGNGVAALTTETGSAVLVGHGSAVSNLDTTTFTAEGALGATVSGFARADGGRVFGSTSGINGDVYERVGTTWSMSLDTTDSELAMAALGEDLYAFSGDRATGGPGRVNVLFAASPTWLAQTDLPVDCVPSAAASHDGQMWVGAGPAADSGDAVLLTGDFSGWTELNLPGDAGTDRQHVSALLSTPDGLAIATATYDSTGQVVSGELLMHNGTVLASLRTYSGDAPLSLGWADNLLYVGLAGGGIEFRENGGWSSEPGVPANDGVVAFLTVDASTLLVGVRGAGGAQILTRRVDLTGGGSLDYLNDVKPLLNTCVACHSTMSTGYSLSSGLSDDSGDYQATLAQVDTGNADNSQLLRSASNTDPHTGGELWATASTEYATVRQWIVDGAVFDSSSGGSGGSGGGGGGGGSTIRYADIKPHINSCATTGCHANTTSFILSQGLVDDTADLAELMTVIDLGTPTNSALLRRPTQQDSHPLPLFTVGSTQYNDILAWIQAGAPN